MKTSKLAIYLLVFIITSFCFAHSAFAATEFISTLQQSGGDYNILYDWEAAINTDLTASSTKVYSVSSTTGTVSDSSTVTGSVSTTTKAKVKHYTSLNNQVLVENIRKLLTGTTTFDNTTSTVTGADTLFTTELQAQDYIWLEASQTWQQVSSIQSDTQLTLTAASTLNGAGAGAQKLRVGQSAFQSGEQLQVDGSNYVTISDTGDSAIAIAKIDGDWTGATDTTAVTIDGWTTDATHYIKIYTTSTAMHQGKWDEGRYQLALPPGGNNHALTIKEQYVRIEGLQIQPAGPTWDSSSYGIYISAVAANGTDIRISHNIIRRNTSDSHVTNSSSGIEIEYDTSVTNGIIRIWNNIIYDFNLGTSSGIINSELDYSIYAYNNTVQNCYYGFLSVATNLTLKNNISYGNTDNYGTLFNTNSANNLSGPSTDAQIPSSGARNGVSVIFVNESGNDFHLASIDTGAKDYATSSVSEIGFTDDIDSESRSSAGAGSDWDIGADEFINTAPDAPTSIGQYLSDCSTPLSTSTFWTSATTLCFKSSISDSNTQDWVKLQIELTTSTFSNSPNYTASDFATSTATSTISVSSLSEGQYRWQARSLDYNSATSSFTQYDSGSLSFGIDSQTPDILTIDAGASSTDRTSLTSDTWFNYSDTGSDDQLSFSWSDPNSLSDDTFYYELNSTSTDSIAGTESTTTNPYIDSITIAEGASYFHVKPKNGAGTWGTERTFTIKYDKSAPTSGSISYTDGYYTATSVAITYTLGSDTGSGLNASTGKIQRKEAVLSAGACASFGSWSDLASESDGSYTDATVVSGKCYQYQYLISDNVSNQAEYTTTSTAKIDASAPTSVSITSITADSSTQLTIYATATDSVSGLHSAPYWFSETSNHTGSSSSTDWQAQTSFTDTGLSPNTQYTYKVKARDSAANESSYSAASSLYTLANIPSDLTLTADSQVQITASWSSNSNPENTEYYIENSTQGTNSSWQTSATWSSSGLSCSTSYSFRVKARNRDNTETSYTSLSTLSTSDCSVSGGGGLPPEAYMLPLPPLPAKDNPQGRFNLIINQGSPITDKRTVNLKLFAGSNVKTMGISLSPDFKNSVQMAYQEQIL